GGPLASRIHRALQQISLAGGCALLQLFERLAHSSGVALAFQLGQALELRFTNRGIVDIKNGNLRLLGRRVRIYADDDVSARVDTGLPARRSLFNTHFGDAGFNRLGHAAKPLHLFDQRPRRMHQFVSKPFDIIRPGPWIDKVCDASFFLQIDLGVARDTGREIGGQRQRFIQCIGVQRLRMSERRGQGLNARAHNVVIRILRGEAPTGGLRMSAQNERFWILRIERLYQLCPQHSRRAHFGNLHEVIHADAPEKRYARREVIDVKGRLYAGAQILKAVGERVGQFNIRGGSRLLHVVSTYTDAVEFRHICCAVAEDVADNSHGAFGRIDIRIADHELFENVVLNGPTQLLRRYSLLFGGVNKER